MNEQDVQECKGWGAWEAHNGYERVAPQHWNEEERALWYEGYDEEQKRAA